MQQATAPGRKRFSDRRGWAGGRPCRWRKEGKDRDVRGLAWSGPSIKKVRAPGLTLTARNAKSQAATKTGEMGSERCSNPESPGVMWEQQWTGTARHWGGEASMGSLYGNFQVPSRRPFGLLRRFRRCPNLPRPGLIPSLHRGLAAGGGACASVTSLEPSHVGPTRKCGLQRASLE